MPTFKQLLEEKNKRLEDIPSVFTDKVKDSQRDIFNNILNLIDELERKDGNILINKKNLLLVEDILDKTKDVVLGSDYIKAVKEFASEFDQQALINDSYFKKVFEDFEESDIADSVLKTSKKNAVEQLIGSPLDTNFLQPIRSQLEDAVSSGASWGDTVNSIRDFVEGTEEKNGKLLQYSKQIASDSYATADRAYTNLISEELGSEWFLYSGGLILDSRDFCIERNGKYFYYKEIEAWANKEWQGKMPNTNEKTIFITAGGFNCKHSIMPVSISIVPKEVIERNIKNGNFKPSEFEIKELGLAA